MTAGELTLCLTFRRRIFVIKAVEPSQKISLRFAKILRVDGLVTSITCPFCSVLNTKMCTSCIEKDQTKLEFLHADWWKKKENVLEAVSLLCGLTSFIIAIVGIAS